MDQTTLFETRSVCVMIFKRDNVACSAFISEVSTPVADANPSNIKKCNVPPNCHHCPCAGPQQEEKMRRSDKDGDATGDLPSQLVLRVIEMLC